MKEILIGVALLLIVGIGGFLYRNEMEQSKTSVASSTIGIACTDEAKVCPDGGAVGRTGSNCLFTTYPPPNVEIQTGSSTIAFVLPDGYMQVASQDTSVLRTYEKQTSQSSVTDLLTISLQQEASSTTILKSKVLKEGNTTFTEVPESGSTHEAQTAYYLSTSINQYKFDLTEQASQNIATTDVDTLPEHQAILKMLETVQTQ